MIHMWRSVIANKKYYRRVSIIDDPMGFEKHYSIKAGHL